MKTPFELDEEQKQIKQKIFPYLKALTYEIVQVQPQQIEKYMIDFLTKIGNYTTSGLTKDEKKELETLRIAIKHYRNLETHSLVNSQNKLDVQSKPQIDSENSNFSDENDDIMDEKEEEEINKKVANMKINQETQNSIKSRVSVSAEVYGLYNRKQSFVPKIIPKNEDQINRIKGKIISSFIFSSLDQKDLEVVINAMEEKRFKLNENVITQGEDGDCLYIVETGLLKCYKTFKKDDSPKFLKNYESGESFGELALLYNCPRAATIVCASDECILWSLDRETFNNIVKDAAQKKREKYENFLKNVDILSTIDSYELGQICDSLKEGIFKKDEYIIREGELGDVFYIIEEGKCNATKTLEPGKQETIIKELKEGDYFGERALLKGEPRYANIIVSSEIAKVISLDRLSFNRLLGPIIEILKRNIDKYQVYCSPNDDKNDINNIADNNINSKTNINDNNLNNLENIITGNNIDNINIPNSVNDNNPININSNDLENNENNYNKENQNNYVNINENQNLNSIITSDQIDNNNVNNNIDNTDKKEENDDNLNNIDNNNKKEDNINNIDNTDKKEEIVENNIDNTDKKEENIDNTDKKEENVENIINISITDKKEENVDNNINNENDIKISSENNNNVINNENKTDNNLTSVQDVITSNNDNQDINNNQIEIMQIHEEANDENYQENNENNNANNKENNIENNAENNNDNNEPKEYNSIPNENNKEGENKEEKLESLSNMIEYKEN